MTEPDYAVLRAPDIAHFPLEGMWFDLNNMPPRPTEGDLAASFISPTGQVFHAVPTNTFEFNQTGQVAEIWEVHLGG